MVRSIRRAAVIGSGVMGSALAALIANAGIPVYLLDIVPNKLTPEEEKKGLSLQHPSVRNRIVKAGMDALQKATPAALFTPRTADLITAGNLEDDFGWIGECDWVLEVIVENLAIKRQLMARIDAARKPDSIISSNTSGIPIGDIAAECSADFKANFLGTHFFNPPRYMKLLEIIPTPDTLPEVVSFMSVFGERTLGKGVVICKDRPNFIANRVGVFKGIFSVGYAVEHGYTVEEIDAITGPVIGQPKTATFRLLDLIGLDVLQHVCDNLYESVPEDEWRPYLKTPDTVRELVKRGSFGNKTGRGFYHSVKKDGGRETSVLDLRTFEYRPEEKVSFDSIKQVRNVESLDERLRFLTRADDRVGTFLWATTSALLSYSSLCIPEITDEIYNLDNALKWGFSVERGPFEIWDALGVAETVERMEADGLPVAAWVKEMLASGHSAFYKRQDGKVFFYDLANKDYRVMPEKPDFIFISDLREKQKELMRNDSASVLDMGDGVLLLEFHSKMNTIDADMVSLMGDAVAEVEANYQGLVIGNQGETFSAGANVFLVAIAAQQGEYDQINQVVKALQDAIMRVRFCQKPVVAAPFGMTLGGGAEICMGAARIVASAETYMGQVEVGVGLLPAGGGCKELLRRIVSPIMAQAPDADPTPLLAKVFELAATGKVSTSAEEARLLGFLTPVDRVIMNRDLLLAEAKRSALQMAEAGYRPPARTKSIYAVGRKGLGLLNAAVFQQLDGGFISEHDAKIGRKIAYVVCGGDLSAPQWVDEEYMLRLEREAFVSLCAEPKTLERIWHILKTGKPLRN